MPSITVRVSDDAARELDALAQAMDRTRSWVVKDALARYLEDERLWLEKVKRGIEAADRGELIPHEQAMKELRRKILERPRE